MEFAIFGRRRSELNKLFRREVMELYRNESVKSVSLVQGDAGSGNSILITLKPGASAPPGSLPIVLGGLSVRVAGPDVPG